MNIINIRDSPFSLFIEALPSTRQRGKHVNSKRRSLTAKGANLNQAYDILIKKKNQAYDINEAVPKTPNHGAMKQQMVPIFFNFAA